MAIAKQYNGEIINGDAMQLYAGLPIITNKITDEEKEGIPHHLLGCIGLHEQTWVVSTFVNRALKVIEGIRARGRLPILVGGTHYYTQSLLFRDRLADADDGELAGDNFVGHMDHKWPVLLQPTEVLLQELKKVDPVMADRWHPNDRRKIQRSLEIYLQSGRKASEIYAGQRLARMNGDVDKVSESDNFEQEPAMRFPTLLLWVHAETDALRDRLDKRVDKMLEQGLLDEVQTLNESTDLQSGSEPVDETRGIWVSIGCKEFKKYVLAFKEGKKSENELNKLKVDAIERTKIATRQYARRQVRWIRIKLVNALAEANASSQLYLLDGSDISRFDAAVGAPSLELSSLWLRGLRMPDPIEISAVAADVLKPNRDHEISAAPERWLKQHCDVCDVTCVIEEQWQQHIKSKAHRKLASKRKQQEKQAEPDITQLQDRTRNRHAHDHSQSLEHNNEQCADVQYDATVLERRPRP